MQEFDATSGADAAKKAPTFLKRPNPVHLLRIEGKFAVHTQEGLLSCDDGYLAFDPLSGHVWPVAASYVDLHYDKV